MKIGKNTEKNLANILKTMDKYFTTFLNAKMFSTALFFREIPPPSPGEDCIARTNVISCSEASALLSSAFQTLDKLLLCVK